MVKIICDRENAKIILSDENSFTEVLCMNRDIDDCYYVLSHVVGENEIGINIEDIRVLNEGKTVQIASATATGENCVTEAFRKAFLNIPTVKTVYIILLIDKDVPNNVLLQGDNMLVDTAKFDPDGTFIWFVDYTDNECGHGAQLTAVIFS